MQNKVQLYIEGQRVDLFSDETIEVTSTIQDFRDIGKIFTSFTQSFRVPASSANNKIFNHFYNFNITGGAFDPRVKKEAFIEINHLPFKEGKIHLNEVSMINNKPHTYDLTFYGKTIALKDILGDANLRDLSQTSIFLGLEHNYDNSTVKSAFETGITYDGDTSALIYPLITPKKRLFYHSGTPALPSDGNLYHNSGSPATDLGLAYTDLKPAIKCKHIIDAIEEKYSALKFTRDTNGDLNKFFGSTAFSNLYLWLSSGKGDIRNYFSESETGISQKTVTKLTGFTTSSDPETMNDDDLLLISQRPSTIPRRYVTTCTVTPDDSNNDSQYTIKIVDTNNNEVLATETTIDGGESAEFVINETSTTEYRDYSLKFVVETFNASAAFTASVSSTLTLINPPNTQLSSQTHNANSGGSITPELKINFDHHIPSIKLLDFLTGLFKMFNLTAYFIEDKTDADYGKIYIDTLDNFYSNATSNKSGGIIDLTKYIDIKEHTVGSTVLYKRINFEYNETDTVLMTQHLTEFGERFGNSEYEPEGVDFGQTYEIQTAFSHLKYERLIDLEDESQTDIQWGYVAGGEFKADVDATPNKGDYEETSIEPLLFYGIRETGLTKEINWIHNGSGTGVTNYWRPSNTNEAGTSTVPPAFTINFDNETDEWNFKDYNGTTNSLFKKFYKSYIESVFNASKRVFRFTAYLPASVLINYKLNDQIRIGDKMFRINSISTNIVTGKSQIELLNIFSNETL
jgi:hypothetical protein